MLFEAFIVKKGEGRRKKEEEKGQLRYSPTTNKTMEENKDLFSFGFPVLSFSVFLITFYV